ncbi:MAG: hypothetical protein L0G59_12665, partial [Kocuria sp.]|nr:hypothetical protein [Kocuria sp.]
MPPAQKTVLTTNPQHGPGSVPAGVGSVPGSSPGAGSVPSPGAGLEVQAFCSVSPFAIWSEVVA